MMPFRLASGGNRPFDPTPRISVGRHTRRGNTVEDLPVIATDPLLTASQPCVDVDIAHGRPFQ